MYINHNFKTVPNHAQFKWDHPHHLIRVVKSQQTVRRVHNDNHNDNDNDNILFSVHLSQGMIINYVHVHYANFALIILIKIF